MTDPKKDDKTPESGKTTVGDLRKMIREEITSAWDTIKGDSGKSPEDQPAIPPAGQPTQQQQSADVKSEVALALKGLRAKEDRDARDAKLDELLAAHEAAKVTPEKPPVEQRRVHKLMGWGE